MAQYFKDAQGTMHEFPDDATPDEIDKATRQLSGIAPAQAAAPKQAAPAANDSPFASLISGKQAPTQIAGEDAATMPSWKNAAYGLVSPVAESIVGVGQMTGLMGDQQAQESMQRIDAVRDRTPGKIAGVVGDVGLLAVPAAKVGKLSKLGQYVGNAGAGAAYGATRGTREGESRGMNTIVGGALGALGQGASQVVGALGKRAAAAIDPLKKDLAKVAQKYKIPLHASQLSDSMSTKVLASAGKHLPFSGAGAAAKKQQAAFNAALGETMGVKGATKLSDEVLQKGKAEIGKVYDDIFKRNDVALDKEAMDALKSVRDSLPRKLDKDAAEQVISNIDYIIANVDAGGKLPGSVYQSLRADLAGVPGKTGELLKDVRKALDDAAFRSVGPEDAAALKKANSQWANARTIQDALKQAGGAAENVNPANLWNLVKKGSTKDMRDLARLGQVILKDPIPDSGTAQRSAVYTALGIGGAATGMLPLLAKAGLAGATVGRAANSSSLANLMLRDGRGQTAQRLAPYLRPAGAAAPLVRDPSQRESDKRP